MKKWLMTYPGEKAVRSLPEHEVVVFLRKAHLRNPDSTPFWQNEQVEYIAAVVRTSTTPCGFRRSRLEGEDPGTAFAYHIRRSWTPVVLDASSRPSRRPRCRSSPGSWACLPRSTGFRWHDEPGTRRLEEVTAERPSGSWRSGAMPSLPGGTRQRRREPSVDAASSWRLELGASCGISQLGDHLPAVAAVAAIVEARARARRDAAADVHLVLLARVAVRCHCDHTFIGLGRSDAPPGEHE